MKHSVVAGLATLVTLDTPVSIPNGIFTTTHNRGRILQVTGNQRTGANTVKGSFNRLRKREPGSFPRPWLFFRRCCHV